LTLSRCEIAVTLDSLFALSGPVVLIGWALLVIAPLTPRVANLVAGYLLPVVLSAGYAALVLTFWWSTEGGFDSLPAVMRLFDLPGVALAGWVHYLAFDLFVGAWEVRSARREGIPHLLVLPCLVLTFLFGPAGFLLFLGLRLARNLALPRPMEA
jgi:hypothetical protein